MSFPPRTTAWRGTRTAIGARVRERRIRPANPQGVRVLTYHGLVETKRDAHLERNFHTVEEFRAHLRILRRHRVVPPQRVIDEAGGASRLTVAITFDDGYKNNEIAADLLEQARMPWALYVSTGEVGRGSTIWTVRLALLLLHGRASHIEAFEQGWDLEDRDQRLTCFAAVRKRAKRLSKRERMVLLDELLSQFEPGDEERLLAEFPTFQMLDWPDLRALMGRGATIGSHGVTHEIHHPGQAESVIEQELSHSRSALDRNLGIACNTLAYPNGDHTERSCQIAKELGYRTAFTTFDGTVRIGADPLSLPRLTARGDEVSFLRSLLRGRSGDR